MWRVVVFPFFCLSVSAASVDKSPPREHPLQPLVSFAQERLQWLSTVKDYTCGLYKRESIDGVLQDYQHIFVKIRHEQAQNGKIVTPFSVYLRFLGPWDIAGREVIYVQGANEGKMIVHKGGTRLAFITRAIDPRSDTALRESRHPITETGFKNMLEQLLEVGRHDMNYGECEVKYYRRAKVNGRVCTVAEITHPVERPYFQYHIAQIFIDDELRLPVRFVLYDWPREKGEKPPLLEEYTLVDVKLNVGLTRRDFDYQNEAYAFSKDFRP
jgi:hypothetical protein